MEDCRNGGPVANVFGHGYFAFIDPISEDAPVQIFPADPGGQLGSSHKNACKAAEDLKNLWFPKQTLPDPTEAQQADKTFMAWLEQQQDEAAKTMEEQMVESVLEVEAAVSVPVLFGETSTTEADKAHAEWLARNRGQMPAHSDPFEENPSSQVV